MKKFFKAVWYQIKLWNRYRRLWEYRFQKSDPIGYAQYLEQKRLSL